MTSAQDEISDMLCPHCYANPSIVILRIMKMFLKALVEAPAAGNLAKNWRPGGYLEKGKVPKDPWGNEFIYVSPGSHGDFDLSSLGADGEPGGEGKNKDINNWEIE